MEFIPAGEFIGESHQIRTVSIADSPLLPDGEYQFIDMYCADPSCDCRKTMIQVLHEGKLVSIINYGWESSDFYKRWMGSESAEEWMPQMQGASIDISSPDRVSAKGILSLFNSLLDEKWIGMFKTYYNTVKSIQKQT